MKVRHDAGMSCWQEDLVGKAVVNGAIGFVARVVRAHAPGTWTAPKGVGNGKPVECWVLELDDGGTLTAKEEADWTPLSALASGFYDGAQVAVRTLVGMLGREAQKAGLAAPLAAMIAASVLARQTNALRAKGGKDGDGDAGT